MDGKALTLGYERNLAEWWELQICATDGVADRNRGLWWTLDRAGGASSIHMVRSSSDTLQANISRCLDEAAGYS